jgi:hypothetical protein
MGKDHIGYDELVDNALRGAMREVLLRVAEHGLMGSHQLYITFRTGFPGVDIPGYLSDRYPDELTIVLQHQFWGLKVTETGFSVTLSFNKAREHVSIPFTALTRFADPGVKFGLQFESQMAARATKLQLVADPGENSGEEDSDAGVSAADGLTEISVSRESMTRAFAPDGQQANGDTAPAESDGGTAGDAPDEADSENGDGAAPGETQADGASGSGAGAEVVTLDSFRKK